MQSFLCGCRDLRSVVFEKGSNLQGIGVECLSICDKLKSIVIPHSVISIKQQAFSFCFNLTSVYFVPNSNLQHSECGAFHECRNLQFINIPSTTIYIHGGAFNRCDALPINIIYTETYCIGFNMDMIISQCTN
jgi:hypothetical protein